MSVACARRITAAVRVGSAFPCHGRGRDGRRARPRQQRCRGERLRLPPSRDKLMAGVPPSPPPFSGPCARRPSRLPSPPPVAVAVPCAAAAPLVDHDRANPGLAPAREAALVAPASAVRALRAAIGDTRSPPRPCTGTRPAACDTVNRATVLSVRCGRLSPFSPIALARGVSNANSCTAASTAPSCVSLLPFLSVATRGGDVLAGRADFRGAGLAAPPPSMRATLGISRGS